MSVQRRQLWFIVPSSAGQALAVDGAGGPVLPSAVIELAERQTTVHGAASHLRTALGLEVPLLEVGLDHDDDGDRDAIDAVVVTEAAPADWRPPAGFAWSPIDLAGMSIADATRPPIADRAAEWLAELATGAEPPARRPRWSRSGWYARQVDWIDDELRLAGRPLTGRPEQVRHWGISALLQARTGSGNVFHKAVFPPFGHEPAVTQFLDRTFPGRVPTVIAADPAEGCLLMDDLGTDVVENGGTDDREAGLRLLVDIQRRLVGRVPELEALGCHIRPLGRLAADLAAVVDERPLLPGITLADERLARLVDWVAATTPELDRLGVPTSLVHGDFHWGNVALVDGRPVIFDWSDAAVGNPLVDIVTSIDRDGGETERELVWQTWLDAWSDAVDANRLRDRLGAVLAIGSAYQAVSYGRILSALEPAARPSLSGGLEHHLAELDRAVPA